VRWSARASPPPAILTGPEQIVGARWRSSFRAEQARRIRGDMLKVKDANYGRRFGNEVRCHVVHIDPENTEVDLHADVNIPGILPAELFDCVILTQVLHFLAPEQALRNVWASIAPGGTLLITAPTLDRLDPHLAATDSSRWTPRALAELLGRVGMPARVTGYGNVLAWVAALWGLSVEDLSAEELDVDDPCSPLVTCAHTDKPA
jgi:SAM-dependent methyltransferase